MFAKPSCLVPFLLLVVLAMPARADLNIFLGDVNRYAAASPQMYTNDLCAQFSMPQPAVVSLMHAVATPADAFMVLQLSRTLHLPQERVLQTYRVHHGKGWGVIAKELGIKPGSAEFHALKNGDLAFSGFAGRQPAGNWQKKGGQGNGWSGPGQDASWLSADDQPPGQGHGRGKGHNK